MGNGSADNLTTSNNKVFRVNIIPGTEGDVTVDIPTNAAEDNAGNGNEAAAQFSIYYNPNAPGVLIYSDEGTITNEQPVPVTIVFSVEVTGFTVDDPVVGNGTAGNLQTLDNIVYTIDITPDSDGTITVLVPANVCQSLDEDNNVESDEFSILYDGTPPEVVIGSVETSPTDAYPIPITITFSEEVEDFTIDDLVVGNGTAANLDTSDNTLFTADIYPASQGDVTVDIPAAAAHDPAGNDNTEATQFLINYTDIEPPGVLITTAENPTDTSPFEVTITFTEIVLGFELTDIAVTDGTAGNFNDTGNPAFTEVTVDITPDDEGIITISVPAGVAQDGAGNPNTAATNLDVLYDASDPGVTITSTVPDPVDTEPIPVTITFTEEVTGFTDTDISVTNGTAGNLQTSDNIVFTADITPTTGAHVVVDIPAEVAFDIAGNGNTPADTSFSVVYDDSQVPGVSLSTTASDPTNVNPIPVTITFTEEVTGFDSTDITVGNGSTGNLESTDNIVFTADITPSGSEVAVSINVAAAAAQDLVGNFTTAAPSPINLDYDAVQPGVSITSTSSDPTDVSPIPVTITFTEVVTGFTLGDIDVGNGTAGNFNSSGNPVFTADITPDDSELTVTVDLAAGVGQDAAGNSNTIASQYSVYYDDTDPTLVISSTASSPTNVSPIPVTITFHEPVTGFTVGDIGVNNGSTSNFNSSGNPVFTVDVTPSGSNVTVTVNVAAGVAQDSVGHWNTAADQFDIYFDNTSPSAGITCGEPDPTDNNPFDVTITFTEAVTGFTSGEISVGNGSVTDFDAVTSAVYTAKITATGNAVTVDVPANAAQDGAGNGNTAAPQFTITVDLNAPVPGDSGALSVRSPAATSCTLNWTMAEDDVSAQADLEYLAYYSDDSAMDTVSEIEANGTPVGSYTANISTASITGLSEDTTYYYNVIVRDEFGKQAAYGKFTDTSRYHLVAFYPFNGDATDESVNTQDGSPNGGMGLTTGLDGTANHAYYFDGGNDWIGITRTANFETATQSFMVWFKTDGAQTANAGFIDKYHNNRGYSIMFGNPATGSLEGMAGDNAGDFNAVYSTNLVDDVWHAAVITIDGTYIRLYTDGVLRDTVQVGTGYSPEASRDIRIGEGEGGVRFKGTLDEIRVYDRVLSDTEVLMIFDMENPTP